jgi:hypothetical protein
MARAANATLSSTRGDAFERAPTRLANDAFRGIFFERDQGGRIALHGAMTMALQTSFPAGSATPPVIDAEEGHSHAEEQSSRLSRWTSAVYLITALATPLLLYFGPDVLSPTTPAIANAALDGRFAVHRHPA